MKPLLLSMQAFGAYADAQIIDFTLLEDKNFFLIHGPTGSGKTTILDAISFALYGSASGDLRESKSLRSDYAPAEEKTEVGFTFTNGEFTYEVLRSPEQELKKQRGEGTRKVPASAALFKILADGTKEPLANKSDEVTKKIIEIIGFKAEQFRQIVLLPQGEFRRFLIAESKDRKAILETIFKTELYRRLEGSLAERSKKIDTDYSQLKQRQQFIFEAAQCGAIEELLAKTEAIKIRQADETLKLTLAQTQLNEVKLKLDAAKELHNAFSEVQNAQTALGALNSKTEFIQNLKTEVAQAEKAAVLEEIYNSTLRAHSQNKARQQELQNVTGKAAAAQNDLQELHQQLTSQLAQFPELSATASADLNEALTLLNQKIWQLNNEAAKLSGVTSELERLAATLIEDEPCPVCGSLHHPAPATVSASQKAELEAKIQTVNRQTKTLQLLQERYQKAQINLASAQAAEVAAIGAAKSAEASFIELRDVFKERLMASEFPTQKELIDALRPESKRQELHEQILAHEQSLAAAQDRLVRAQALIEGKTLPDLAPLLDAQTEGEALHRTLTAQVALSGKELADAEQQTKQLTELAQKMSVLQTAYQTAASLAETAKGNNPARLAFSAFVLQAILDDVLQAANLRLTSMSRGRYSLSRTGDVLDARRENGLNIEVTDSFTGVARPVKTLSGGEIFLASLSLALGLSDVVQAYSGGIRLDTILVDEGFGTLDTEALDMAIRTLTDLQKGGRLVGIISHVSELRERISARLEVIPGERGSKAIFRV